MKNQNKIGLVACGFLLVAGFRWGLLHEADKSRSSDQVNLKRSKGDELEAERMKSLAAQHRDVSGSAFYFTREIALYGHLRSKVFLKDEDKLAKTNLFGNRELVQGVGEFLQRASSSDYDSQVQQTTAIDFLLEAAKSPQGKVAAEAALHQIISDAQIENEDLPAEARKNLAGVKAEVLFQWSVQDPSKTEVMQAWLPGPVSQKIWENVTDAQNRNLRESLAVGPEGATASDE